MNNEAEGDAVVTSMGNLGGTGWAPRQREIDVLEVERAIARLKCGKSAGMTGIPAEVLKCGGDANVIFFTVFLLQVKLSLNFFGFLAVS